MKTLILLSAPCISLSSYSQKALRDTARTVLQVAKELSYYWKLDSLASNGFRLYTYEEFLKCNRDKVYADELLNRLGKPNKVRQTNKGIEYLYYCFDKRKMPKNYNAPSAIWYIAFKFENEQNTLSTIEEGDIDL